MCKSSCLTGLNIRKNCEVSVGYLSRENQFLQGEIFQFLVWGWKPRATSTLMVEKGKRGNASHRLHLPVLTGNWPPPSQGLMALVPGSHSCWEGKISSLSTQGGEGTQRSTSSLHLYSDNPLFSQSFTRPSDTWCFPFLSLQRSACCCWSLLCRKGESAPSALQSEAGSRPPTFPSCKNYYHLYLVLPSLLVYLFIGI